MTDIGTLGQRRLGHVGALDGIRGLAVLLVIGGHFRLLSVEWIARNEVYARVTNGGFMGVEIFFVLSGFLITTLLLRERSTASRVHIGHFYGRRALRLLPALFVMLFIVTIVTLNDHASTTAAWPYGHPAYSFSDMWPTLQSALLYYSNWFFSVTTGTRINDFGHLWSLSIEEQFYLVWPAVLLVLLAVVKRDAIRSALLAAAFVFLAFHRLNLATSGIFLLKLYSRTDTRIDGLVIGCLVAFIHQKGWISLPVRRVLAIVGSVIVVFTIVTTSWTSVFLYKYGLTIFNLGVAMVILRCVEGDGWFARVFSWTPLRGVGKISYGLYLWNFPVVCFLCRHIMTWRVPYRLATATAVILAITLASWFLVERPALRLKDRWFASGPRQVDAVQPLSAAQL